MGASVSDLASPADQTEADFLTAESSVYHPKHEQTDQEKLSEQEALTSGHQSLRARLLEETVGKAQAVGGVALELAKASNDRMARARGRRRQSKDSEYAFKVHTSICMCLTLHPAASLGTDRLTSFAWQKRHRHILTAPDERSRRLAAKGISRSTSPTQPLLIPLGSTLLHLRFQSRRMKKMDLTHKLCDATDRQVTLWQASRRTCRSLATAI